MANKRNGKAEAEHAVTARTLLVHTTEGEFKVTLPVGARVTFGPTIPYQKKNNGYGGADYHHGYSLRVYENARNDSLVAVFCDVKSFRDITMPHAKLVIRESGTSVWKSDEEGYDVQRSVKKERSFHQLEALKE